MTTPLDWLIVGGGVHGTHLSHVLVNRAGMAPDRVRVLDPQEHPLETFWRVTGGTGMRYLRSPGVHHVDLHPHALRRFAKKGAGKRLARFVYPYDRPGLEFFRAHTEHVVHEHGLVPLATDPAVVSAPEGAALAARERGGFGAEPVVADATPAGVRLRLDRAPHLLEVDRAVLATGFEVHRPGGALLGEEAIDRLGLPCADCGYPLVSPRLERASGLFVTGPLAELELGPTARTSLARAPRANASLRRRDGSRKLWTRCQARLGSFAMTTSGSSWSARASA